MTGDCSSKVHSSRGVDEQEVLRLCGNVIIKQRKRSKKSLKNGIDSLKSFKMKDLLQVL